MSTISTPIIIITIIWWNSISIYFWIRFYKECFNKHITRTEIIQYGFFSAISALWIIKLFALTGILSKVISEEATKIVVSESNPKHDIHSDHIITAILSWVAFAIIENIVYLFYLQSDIIIQISLIRIATNSIIHGLFTGSIGYGIYVFLAKKKLVLQRISTSIFYIIAWVSMHFSYNRLIYKSYVAFAFIFVIIWYFWLSFLLYKSDRLYLQ